MLLIDWQQLMYATLHAQSTFGQGQIQPGLLKHSILNVLRGLISRFKEQNTDKIIVICCDSKNSWRKDSFPFYKASRKKVRDASTHIDWTEVFPIFDQLKVDLKENFPYIVIDVDQAEADDIIGVLTNHYSKSNVIIVSADKDFLQLHRPGVIQWDNIRSRYLSTTNNNYLNEHILQGDRGDGIPNVLSDNDCFVIGKRQTTLRQKTIDKMIAELNKLQSDNEMVSWQSDITRNFLRNKLLIDLSMTPQHICDEIIHQFETQKKSPKKSNILNYLMANRMSDLIQHMQEFV